MLDPTASRHTEETMAEKSKQGREARKPKADKNKKAKGQTPAPRSAAVDAINHAGSNAPK
jgi:hypothetical protein